LHQAASSFFMGAFLGARAGWMGNLQVRFLEGWAPAMAPGYSTMFLFAQHGHNIPLLRRAPMKPVIDYELPFNVLPTEIDGIFSWDTFDFPLPFIQPNLCVGSVLTFAIDGTSHGLNLPVGSGHVSWNRRNSSQPQNQLLANRNIRDFVDVNRGATAPFFKPTRAIGCDQGWRTGLNHECDEEKPKMNCHTAP
jgi:hypothetical protein